MHSIHSSPFIHQGSQVIQEGYQVKNMLTAPSHLFVLYTCLEMVYRIICSVTFPSAKVKLTDLWFPRSSFLTFLNIESDIFFFSSQKCPLI